MSFTDTHLDRIRPKVTYDQICLLFASSIRNISLYELAKGVNLESHWNSDFDTIHLLNWFVDIFYNKYKTLPTAKAVYNLVNDYVKQKLIVLDDYKLSELFNLYKYVYKLKQSELYDKDTFRYYLQCFIEDISQNNLLHKLSNNNTTPVDLAKQVTAEADKLNNLHLSDSVIVEEPFSDGWDAGIKENYLACGLDFLDYFMDGGMLPGEVYGLFGPFGSCKTMSAINCSINMASQYRQEWKAGLQRGALKYVYYINYELMMKTVLYRALSYFAKISFKKLIDKDYLYTSVDGPSDADRLWFKDSIEHNRFFMCEKERKDIAIELLNTNWRALDFSGGDGTNPNRGSGYIKEIQNVISDDLRRNTRLKGINIECGGVIIDYVGAMVKRHLPYCGIKDKAEYILNNRAPMAAGSDLAKYFGCPVLLIQQLNADANRLNPTETPDHTDAVAARTFAENLDFCFCYGRPDNNQLCKIKCTKHRRTGSKDSDIVKIHGEFNQLESVGHLYEVDRKAKAFKQRDIPTISNKEKLEKINGLTTSNIDFDFFG